MKILKHSLSKNIFKRGSKTYYYSSLFFPKDVRKDVSVLYSFVRKADDFVDSIPQDVDGFYDFKNKYEKALSGKRSKNKVIDSFIELQDREGFDTDWIQAFFHSMELDITKSRYENIDELKQYLYGSAEVIGLMMAKILDLPEESYMPARYLGRAMQYANFIRDIEEDMSLGRHYFPASDLEEFGLRSLEHSETRFKKDDFSTFMEKQVRRYDRWQEVAEDGFRYIPKRYLIPIKTSSDMYKWTTKGIRKEPYLVYDKKLKPSKSRIIAKGMMNIFQPKKHGN